jgi:hypothetical protein
MMAVLTIACLFLFLIVFALFVAAWGVWVVFKRIDEEE